ncbi:MAG: leucine--tRNA ligase [Opitutaceae bacterium]|jgi:leucyl-tRNA synthetase|nr:leucine--tRNA ligase [Opitutaceae bacterium]
MATNCTAYDFSQIEPHWQKIWDDNKTFRTSNDPSKPKYYVLDMFPYPSGSGLHIGHPEGYTATDIIARARRAQGNNVLHPIGWDAFGLPAEQHAVKTGAHPASNTQANIAAFRRQLKALGFCYDWDRQVDTTDPKYFKWTQWIFLQLFKRGLAYVDERPVWWCPELRTVLANEEVIDGKSEVGHFPVERRNLRQWVLRITAYAERLLADLAQVDWPDSTKRMQEAWIGRSEGAEVIFALELGTPAAVASASSSAAAVAPAAATAPSAATAASASAAASPAGLKVFTTRPDTLFGATYMVIAPEHPLVDALTTPAQRDAVAAYRKAAAAKSDLDRTDLAKDKSGIFSGSHAINPVNGARIPVWIADYVLMGYGTGAIMAVPAHDQRDWEFARKFSLPIIPVVKPPAGVEVDLDKAAFEAGGIMQNSAGFDGLPVAEAKKKITAALAAENRARATVNYKLRDWLFSRQRYWGEPFPIVWVDEAAYKTAAATRAADLPPEPVTYVDGEKNQTLYALPLPATALPLALPDIQNYLPSGTGESPLANATDWLEIWFNTGTGQAVPAWQIRPAGDAWVRARRETNTMPQWAGSCWYYLRYPDPENDRAFADPALLKYWGVPDLYVGGAEHAVLHLLYSRFWHKVLFDIGAVPQNEPFKKLFHQGIILGEDGEKMSKSRGNTVNPDDIIKTHGADTLRLYLMFLGPLEAMKPWNPQGIEGVHRFLQKVWREVIGREGGINEKISATAQDGEELTKLLHETIKKVTDDIDSLRFNTAISAMMIFSNALQKAPVVNRATVLAFIQILAPFAPHIAQELWTRLGGQGDILDAPWPKHDAARLVVTEQKIVIQVNGKKRGEVMLPVGATQDAALAAAKGNAEAAPHLAGKEIKKVIYVPGRILNLVAM